MKTCERCRLAIEPGQFYAEVGLVDYAHVACLTQEEINSLSGVRRDFTLEMWRRAQDSNL